MTVAVLSYMIVGTLPFPTWSSILGRSREASQR